MSLPMSRACGEPPHPLGLETMTKRDVEEEDRITGRPFLLDGGAQDVRAVHEGRSLQLVGERHRQAVQQRPRLRRRGGGRPARHAQLAEGAREGRGEPGEVRHGRQRPEVRGVESLEHPGGHRLAADPGDGRQPSRREGRQRPLSRGDAQGADPHPEDGTLPGRLEEQAAPGLTGRTDDPDLFEGRALGEKS